MAEILGENRIAHDGFEHSPNEGDGCEYCSARKLTLAVIELEAERDALVEEHGLLRRKLRELIYRETPDGVSYRSAVDARDIERLLDSLEETDG